MNRIQETNKGIDEIRTQVSHTMNTARKQLAHLPYPMVADLLQLLEAVPERKPRCDEATRAAAILRYLSYGDDE